MVACNSVGGEVCDPAALDVLAGLREDLLIAWEIEFPHCLAVK